jgi:hypothetical protein
MKIVTIGSCVEHTSMSMLGHRVRVPHRLRGYMNAIQLLTIPCKTPTTLIRQAFKYTVGTSKLPKKRILNELAKYDCEHARYWINELNQCC